MALGHRKRRGVLVVGVAIAALTAACGSTVRQETLGSADEGGALSAGAGDEFKLPGSAESTTVGPGSAPGSGPGAGAGSGQATLPGRGGTSPTSPPGAAGSPGAPADASSGPGFTTSEIYIGVAYNSLFDEQAAAAGVATEVGDQREQAIAIANDINSRGGIAGRRIVLVFYDTVGQQNDRNAAAQAACVRFTEDQLVFAAMSAVSQISNDTLFTCLARRGAVSIGGVLGGGYDAGGRLAQFAPSLYLPAGAAIERISPVWAERLEAGGYYGPWNTTTGQPGLADVKIGLLYGSNGDTAGPVGDALAATLTDALERQGRRFEVAFPTTGDANEMNQAVLRFRDAGVTHVIGDAALIQFLPAAASQNYRPRIGFGVSGTALIAALASPGQLNGAVGIGWNPPIDVDNARDPGELSPAQRHCREVMEEAGQPTDSRLAWAVMALMCDSFNFLAGAINSGGLSAQGVRQGAAAMGSMQPSSTFAISFPGGRPDGAAALRDMAYRNDCMCFVYTSNENRAM